jgi:PAS domain S-box-containing protein
VGGDELLGQLEEGEKNGQQSLCLQQVDPATIQRNGDVGENVDCLVIDATVTATSAPEIVESWVEENPDTPAIVLIGNWDDTRVADTLTAGTKETLPRRLLSDDPDLVAQRVAAAAKDEHAKRSFRELYDSVAEAVSVHDPETGELLHANQSLCDLLGYDRDAVLSMQVGDFTADVPGYDHERAMNVVSSVSDDDDVTVEWPLVTADGAIRWARAHLCRARLSGREVVLFRSIDVTEQRRTERTYEQVFDNVNDVISVHDPWAKEVVDVNETLCELTGYSREALLEMDLGGISATGEGYTGERGYDLQQSVAATGDSETVDWKIETASGDSRLLECVLSPTTIAGEDRVLILARDVTERRRLEQTYREVFESVSDGLVVHDPETGEITDVNERFCEMNGYEREELIGETVDFITAPEHSYERAQERIEAAREEGPQLFEWQNQRKDGETVPVEVHLSVVDVHGEERVLGSVRDITQRKRREREYEQIFDGVKESIVVQDPETAGIVDVNEAFLSRLGYEDVETVREQGFEAVSATADGFTKERAQKLCRRIAETGESETVEWQQVTKSGDKHWIEATLVATEIRGEQRILSIQRDITERKRRERTVRALHESTDALQEAETPEDVAGAAVDAAGEVLDLWLPTCWLHGIDQPGVLSPVAASDAATELPPGAGPGVLAPGDREYEIYDDGESGVYDPDELDGGRPPGDAILLSLGDHGLLGAVDRNGKGFDDVTLDAAEILARHVTAALDRVERERELRESERRFRLIADHIDEIVYLATADFSEILYINPVYEEIYGQPVGELDDEPTSFVEAAHPEDRERYRDDVERLVADIEAGDPKDAYEGQYRIVRNGDIRWVTVSRFPVENEDGTVDRIVGQVQDVTERRRREREYEQIFDGVTDAITVHDPETGELLDVNERMCELTGYDRDELLAVGQDAINVAEEGYTSERARDIVQSVMAENEPRTLEWLIERADGKRRQLEINATPATLNGEDRYLAIMRDVTEQRQTERRLRDILDRIDEAIFMTRAQEITSATQAPDYVSSGYEDIWGQPLEEIRQAHEDGFFSTLHPEDESGYAAFVEGIVEDIAAGTAADSYSREYRIERPDGEVRWVHSDFYPTEWQVGPTRIVIVSRDITERKERERRIASFDDATDDLATADTPAEATRTAVEAAAETLDLPAVGAFLYDDDDGVLRPEVQTGPLPSEGTVEPAKPNESPLWESFATGTVVAPNDEHATAGQSGERGESAAGLSVLADWRALAVGNHGTLLVGTPDSALDPETVQQAHVLAATLEAALNHLHGQERLAAQEKQLRTQTERAERLDRIARLTQQVEAAITDASNPGEVERAVCDRLARAEPYDLAWVGGLAAGSDRLVARAVVGASEQYVTDLQLTTTDDTADPHPAVAAWRTDEVQVADSIVGNGPAEDWRRRVLTEGYQSIAAFPLTYDGVTHGVLTVGTDTPGAFGDRERDVLAQLGTSIANAVAAIERRRALESDETVELEFEGAGEQLPFARAARQADCRVRLERTAARQDGSVSVYFSFEGDVPDDLAAIASQTLPGAVELVTDEASSTLVEVRPDDWFGAPLAEYGGVLRDASADPDGTTITVEVPRQADVRSFVERLQSVDPSLELVAQRQHSHRNQTPGEIGDRIRAELTDRQFEVLRTALSAGYFEWPREHDGSDVAARLDITQPTLNKHLRLAEKQIFSLLFDEE